MSNNIRHICFYNFLSIQVIIGIPIVVTFKTSIGCVSIPPNKKYKIENLNYSQSYIEVSSSISGTGYYGFYEPYITHRFFGSDNPFLDISTSLPPYLSSSFLNQGSSTNFSYNDIIDSSALQIDYNKITITNITFPSLFTSPAKTNTIHESNILTAGNSSNPDLKDFHFNSGINNYLCFSAFPNMSFDNSHGNLNFKAKYSINFDLIQE